MALKVVPCKKLLKGHKIFDLEKQCFETNRLVLN